MRIILILLLSSISLHAQLETNYVIVVNDTNSPVVTTAGSQVEAESYFFQGLEDGGLLSAILFGFISVRRALSMGDAWND